MMKELTRYITAKDGTQLFVRIWSPEAAPKAVVQVVHGMAEHSQRYGRLAEALCKAGYEVWADDHRGHGQTAQGGKNAPESGGLLGHCADKDGFNKVVADLKMISAFIKQERPNLPLFLFGHSWGSFLAQAYIERSEHNLAGCILSGTRGPGGPEVPVGAALASLIAFIRGCRKFSPLVYNLADGPYNKAFKPNRTNFDWLSRDEREVDAYVADPLCGFPCSVAFYRDLARGLQSIHRKEALDRIPKNLPLFIFAGSADPVGDMGKSPTKLVEAYKQQGIKDLEFILYPEGRHEMLNEINREEVIQNLLAWINRHL
ncbi:MAG: alpha/beta hydrolase [Treponema sp.]|nr:alpha/beta hydrolase [Treponema sp.]